MRRTLGIPLALAGLVLAAMPTLAQEVGQTSFTLRSIPGPAWADADGVRNPTLTVPPGAAVTVTVVNDDGGYHNFQAGAHDPSDYLDEKGTQLTYAFTAPESGTMEYKCPVHPVEMKGTIRVAGGGDVEKKESPGLAVLGALLALAGAALVLRRG